MLVEDFVLDVSDGYRITSSYHGAMHPSVHVDAWIEGSLVLEHGKAFANLPACFHLHVSSL